jgi:hypothetical protein
MSNIEAVFRMRPPDGKPFMAAVVKAGEGYGVISNRSGDWEPDTIIHVADLLMPEQRLGEWDIEQVPDRAEGLG